MTKLKIAEVINQWVETKLGLPFTIYNDTLPDTDESAACLRYAPAPAAERRYIDGTRLLRWSLTYYVRNKSRENARDFANDITTCLDGAEITDTETGATIQTEAQTLPQFLYTDEKNNTIYSAAIVCIYLERKTEE